MNLIVFDIDGTLTDTSAVDEELYFAALREAWKVEPEQCAWGAFENVTDSGVAEEIFARGALEWPREEALRRLHQRFIYLMKKEHAANPARFNEVRGAGAAVEGLRRRPNWTVSLATGCWRDSARFKLWASRISLGGIPMACAEDSIRRVEIVKDSIRRAKELADGQEFDRVVMFGDGDWDVRAARELGLPLVGVGSGARAEKLRALGVSHVLEDYSLPAKTEEALKEAQVPAAV
ncbi:MAG: haloacid dehalogenase-like hydrolase [Candidatus Sumerlaeia bacterium]|nr:haloacid dehalogenase-like hydrolase [Candidatus Sumerlaeia bacterium]